MKNKLPSVRSLTIVSALILMSFLLSACFNSGNDSTEKYLYTSTNSPSGNEVIRFNIERNGDISSPTSTTTGRYRTGNSTNAAGDADDGDFDSQGALHIIDNYLLVVNAGEQSAFSNSDPSTNARTNRNGSISVMKIDRGDGSLELMGTPVNSQGVRPVSITSVKIGATRWVIVANQYDNPYCRETSDDVFACDPVVATDVRNLVAFTFDKGVLTFRGVLETFSDGQKGGVSQVSFSPDDKKLAVSTWGVPLVAVYEQSDIPNMAAAGFRESAVKVWEIGESSATTIGLTKHREWTQRGVSGSIGFQWDPESRYIYLTSFNSPIGAVGSINYSVVALNSNAGTVEVPTLNLVDWSGTRYRLGSTTMTREDTTNVLAGIPDEACWAWISPNGRQLYTASFNSNIISFFNINAEGNDINLVQAYTRKDPNPSQSIPIPRGDTKDLFIPRDGSFLYALGAFRSHTITYYAIDGAGGLTEASTSPHVVYPSNNNPQSSQEAFMGLTGF